MEIGKKYRIVFKDGNYTKIMNGTILSEDEHFIRFEDRIIGELHIGKNTIITIKKLE